jgi:hypothetical protein
MVALHTDADGGDNREALDVLLHGVLLFKPESPEGGEPQAHGAALQIKINELIKTVKNK